jgi:hypothetical protein
MRVLYVNSTEQCTQRTAYCCFHTAALRHCTPAFSPANPPKSTCLLPPPPPLHARNSNTLLSCALKTLPANLLYATPALLYVIHARRCPEGLRASSVWRALCSWWAGLLHLRLPHIWWF